jgi:hypothetical protein
VHEAGQRLHRRRRIDVLLVDLEDLHYTPIRLVCARVRACVCVSDCGVVAEQVINARCVRECTHQALLVVENLVLAGGPDPAPLLRRQEAVQHDGLPDWRARPGQRNPCIVDEGLAVRCADRADREAMELMLCMRVRV